MHCSFYTFIFRLPEFVRSDLDKRDIVGKPFSRLHFYTNLESCRGRAEQVEEKLRELYLLNPGRVEFCFRYLIRYEKLLQKQLQQIQTQEKIEKILIVHPIRKIHKNVHHAGRAEQLGELN
ncbi:hypothetical protein F511_17507 [Dorcoceras hygrometricum]|uniref:Uncharacterized protein n=1 Tax=Dorcoceras hygrometricum TaxID=472368 RepID=A0A2Z7ASQ3_9LAMI|nr:hypothetical protein F511_17507 [Dorcoceras hygrometricum]